MKITHGLVLRQVETHRADKLQQSLSSLVIRGVSHRLMFSVCLTLGSGSCHVSVFGYFCAALSNLCSADVTFLPVCVSVSNCVYCEVIFNSSPSTDDQPWCAEEH